MTAFLLDYAVKASVILLIAFAVLPFLRKQSASLRHGVLLTAIAVSALIPALTVFMPAWNIGYLCESSAATAQQPALSGGGDTARTSDSTSAPATGGRSMIAERLPLALWLAGLTLGSIVLLTGILRLTRVASASRPVTATAWSQLSEAISHEYGLRRPVRLLQSSNPSILVTWGLRRPKILLPAGAGSWTEERINVVLRHELAHVRRYDWLGQTAAEALRIVCWFNPLLWLACSRLRLESEHACDDAAIANGIAGADYAAHLLALARTLNATDRAWSAALSMARPSTVERRFAAMLKPTVNRVPISRRTTIAVVVSMFCVALPLAALSLSRQPLPQPPAPPIASYNPAFGQPVTTREVAKPAQNTSTVTQSMAGTITDQRNVPISQVEVTIAGPAARQLSLSDAHGQYHTAHMISGAYRVSFAKPGYKTLNVDNVSLDTYKTLIINEVMQLPATSEEVTVRSGQQAHVQLLSHPPSTIATNSQSGAGMAPALTTSDVKIANLLEEVVPAYPPGAQTAMVQGVVVLTLTIGIDGLPYDLKVVSGPPMLIPTAIDAVKQWRYAPSLLDGLPMPVASTVTMNFALQ